MFENKNVELWYIPKYDNLMLYFKGNFFNPGWCQGKTQMKMLFSSPTNMDQEAFLIEEKFCSLEDL